MLGKFQAYVQENGLFTKSDRLLVGVSGGADSMVLVHLLLQSGYNIGIAHCNYQLRGEESDKDQQHVQLYAEAHGLPFHLKTLDTQSLVLESNASVQMVARDERYKFFADVGESEPYDLTLLAHNADDRVESLILNVLRGTGVRGFIGMPLNRNNLARPLLFTTKREIVAYAKKNNVEFRQDSSNLKTDYQRNWVRLRLMPMLEAKMPGSISQLLAFTETTSERMSDYHDFVANEMAQLSRNGANKLQVKELKLLEHPFTILREVLNPYGFSSNQVFETLKLFEAGSGAFVENDQIRVVRDRDELIILEKALETSVPRLKFSEIDVQEISTLKVDPNTLLIDATLFDKDKMHVRKWKKGDRFKPFGMNGWKKVSDFLIDTKVPVGLKDDVWLLTQEGEVVWVIGMRADNRFRITDGTKKVLKVEVAE